jgi:hypothetical protein
LDGANESIRAPEYVPLLVTDEAPGPEPWFVMTGHTLTVGDPGSTELASDAAEDGCALFRSAQRWKALPDYLDVLPGAYAGSACGRRLSGKPNSTIGSEKRDNQAFWIDDQAAFVSFMLEDIPVQPAQAAELRAANSGLIEARP